MMDRQYFEVKSGGNIGPCTCNACLQKARPPALGDYRTNDNGRMEVFWGGSWRESPTLIPGDQITLRIPTTKFVDDALASTNAATDPGDEEDEEDANEDLVMLRTLIAETVGAASSLFRNVNTGKLDGVFDYAFARKLVDNLYKRIVSDQWLFDDEETPGDASESRLFAIGDGTRPWRTLMPISPGSAKAPPPLDIDLTARQGNMQAQLQGTMQTGLPTNQADGAMIERDGLDAGAAGRAGLQRMLGNESQRVIPARMAFKEAQAAPQAVNIKPSISGLGEVR